ncbi:hypothetical protein TWF569_011987 [Orbilia oligospora]|nr:hypothetical protein TWF569_011987 [Orbilia oligospora]
MLLSVLFFFMIILGLSGGKRNPRQGPQKNRREYPATERNSIPNTTYQRHDSANGHTTLSLSKITTT